jgi:transcriptional regulator with XRE-family HTH domain
MSWSWAKRIRSYRVRSNLTQEGLAELFMVDARTVSRWETGKSRPSQAVMDRLRRSHVPVIGSPLGSAIKDLVESSSELALLTDMKMRVIANSRPHKALVAAIFNADVVGQDYAKFAPDYVMQALEAEGGWRHAVDAGLSSSTGDYFRAAGTDGVVSPTVCVRAQMVMLRLADGEMVSLTMTRPIPIESLSREPVRFTYLDEVMSDG